ncbi:hypothetical protein ACRALDRAFT_1068503 [Sodiomyces alcalophilus JCM 7366]|uniref:uncharacterized protein n=1 Tax=Sodiomyces alcalophilus JCM 7366 TaxID=591952 RepID=UPI0039B58705
MHLEEHRPGSQQRMQVLLLLQSAYKLRKMGAEHGRRLGTPYERILFHTLRSKEELWEKGYGRVRSILVPGYRILTFPDPLAVRLGGHDLYYAGLAAYNVPTTYGTCSSQGPVPISYNCGSVGRAVILTAILTLSPRAARRHERKAAGVTKQWRFRDGKWREKMGKARIRLPMKVS